MKQILQTAQKDTKDLAHQTNRYAKIMVFKAQEEAHKNQQLLIDLLIISLAVWIIFL